MGGTTGRMSIPQQVKIANGNPGKRPDDVDPSTQPQPELVIPEAPDYLDDVAKEEWGRISELLFKNNLLSEIDGYGLAIYCQAWSRMRKAELALEKESLVVTGGTGGPIKNPLIGIIALEKDTVIRMLREFGMTPAARCRVKGPPGSYSRGVEDKWQQFAKGRVIPGGKK